MRCALCRMFGCPSPPGAPVEPAFQVDYCRCPLRYSISCPVIVGGSLAGRHPREDDPRLELGLLVVGETHVVRVL